MTGLPRRVLTAVAGVAVIAVIAVAVGVVVDRRGNHMHITAYFRESNGIYAGNHVDILGLPVGSVSSITPEPGQVKVVLSLPAGTKIPLSAQAYIVPPSVISDRYVGLSPAYSGRGPVMPDGYVLHLDRTHEPAEFDQLVGSLTTLFNALGPKQAGAKGAVGRLIHVLSQNLDGNGARIHATIEGLSSATAALTSDRGAFTAVISSLDRLSKNLAARDALIGSFNADLAAASSQLAGERNDITRVIDNLSSGLLALASFLRSHRAAMHGDLSDLVATTSVLLQHQRALIETLDNLPLAAQNLGVVEHHGSIVVKNANIGDNLEYRKTIAALCAALRPLCAALGGLATPAATAAPAVSARSPASSPADLSPLFGVGR
jgi:phospholipid/cholesterol/gamma-HCH transport system substrate-binding protein